MPDPDAAVVKRIFDMAEAGKGTIDIARSLNDEDILSPRGNLLGKTSVHAILINEAYTGTLVWGTNSKHRADPVRVEKAFPATITRKQFDSMGKLMRERAPGCWPTWPPSPASICATRKSERATVDSRPEKSAGCLE